MSCDLRREILEWFVWRNDAKRINDPPILHTELSKKSFLCFNKQNSLSHTRAHTFALEEASTTQRLQLCQKQPPKPIDNAASIGHRTSSSGRRQSAAQQGNMMLAAAAAAAAAAASLPRRNVNLPQQHHEAVPLMHPQRYVEQPVAANCPVPV